MNYEFTTHETKVFDVSRRSCSFDGVTIFVTAYDYEDAVNIMQHHARGSESIKLPVRLARTLAAELIAAADAWDAYATAQGVAA